MVAIFINGLNYAIQDELVIHHVTSVDEAYQLALRVEDKLARQVKKRPYVSYGHTGHWKQPQGVNHWASGGRSVESESLDQNVVSP